MPNTTTHYSWSTVDSDGYVKDTATYIAALATQVDNTLWDVTGGKNVGLQLITSATIGSNVTSVTVSNCFSSTYDNYRILVSGGSNSTGNYINVRVGSATTGYYNNRVAADYAGGVPGNASVSNETRWYYVGYSSTTDQALDMYVQNPYVTKPTLFNSTYALSSFGATCQGYLSDSVSHSSVTLLCSTGMTGGNIAIYGYRKS